MKNLLGLIVLVVVVVSCSFGKKDSPPKPATTTPAIDSSTASPSSSSLTLERFNQLRDGMQYEDVARILGGEGTETNSSSFGSVKTVTYKWQGEKHARVTVVFRDGRLSSKIQMNLKGGGTDRASVDLTLAKYNQIQDGMNYEEVVRIVGSEGIQTSSSTIGAKTASYKWEGEKYSRLYATFRDSKLSSKSQANLK